MSERERIKRRERRNEKRRGKKEKKILGSYALVKQKETMGEIGEK